MSELLDQRIDNANAAEALSLVVVTLKSFISGLIGGCCEDLVGYPLETVKARMQTQQRPFDCFTKSVQDGGLVSLHRSVSPQIICYGICLLKSAVWQSGFYSHSCRGFNWIHRRDVITPFEVIKVKLKTLCENVKKQLAVRLKLFRRSGLKRLSRLLVDCWTGNFGKCHVLYYV
ncbi:hypothetical protein PsorP6_004086 [Peronosclerospora sorghi]|uniref:Uncharacterized protein n=1 Tax=Peronosclerospora sorghi TaxID=230839 RepID=A0ACC0VRJ2_9STRA|nr:hypothetical protein PsorP6_004086 [Peronosclerospora sorghi]